MYAWFACFVFHPQYSLEITHLSAEVPTLVHATRSCTLSGKKRKKLETAREQDRDNGKTVENVQCLLTEESPWLSVVPIKLGIIMSYLRDLSTFGVSLASTKIGAAYVVLNINNSLQSRMDLGSRLIIMVGSDIRMMRIIIC